MRSEVSSSISAMGASGMMPAVWTTTSTPPKCSVAVSKREDIAVSSATSPPTELIGAAQSDPDLAAAVSERYTRPRRTLAVDYFRKAAERGQLRADVDLQLLVDQLWGACYNRLLVPDAPLDEEFAVALVTNTLYGAAAADYRGEA